MATPKMDKSWRRIRDRIKETWSEVEFEDKRLRKARGDLRYMVTLIRTRVDESRAEIRRKVVAAM